MKFNVIQCCGNLNHPRSNNPKESNMANHQISKFVVSAFVVIALCGCGSKDSGLANTGIAECDSYLNKVYQCLNSVSSDVGKQMLDSMKASEATLKQAAAANRDAVAASCKVQMDQAKNLYAQLGCKQFD
jgi:hypothetical protein